jgi:hypothetical protein
MLPTGTRALFAGVPPEAEPGERERYQRLSRLLPDGHFHAERAPQRLLPAGVASQMLASHTLPIGWEQRVEPPAKGGSRRIFYMDHFTRTTQLADPRTSADAVIEAVDEAGEDPLNEFLLLSSGVLSEQHVGPADYRAALNRALRHSLHGQLEGYAPGGLRERRLQLQQHIQLACLERLFGRGVAPAPLVALAYATFVQHHAPPTPAAPDRHVLDSLLRHSSSVPTDPMGLYTSGARGLEWLG